ncbi:FAD linked oxidase N-terminal [Penicillium canescens]|uniref:FAD linked oxidase N-terminal n=1 Tax=Penicillium canescens TaxID=5083 RepID=A0AAD6I8E7_PENCN|nr:FAD linked oxidase N-terminal [Penicillium canescens]KAJ6035593.1 FAD linked oxidase N-terminal [Penicillium canescens]KAJ6037716.1 FAD linked oxidase N-terminal [Penicillium canescens]KAJ6054342.1 FAD linked oxidase N-terminal [Penicillium canescens]
MAPRSVIAGVFLGALALTASVSAQVVEQVSSDSQSGAPLFTSETLQLTDQALASVNSNQSALFQFKNSSSLSTRTVGGCKVFPGDFWWPSTWVWSLFDKFLGGALIKTIPLAASCYSSWPEYDANECAVITDDWTNSNLHAADAASVMWPLFEGRTCLPTTNASGSCTVGGYSSYAVNATTVAQIQLAVNFARNAGLRFVVKNTGHDFNGKSTGAGALGIWTHHLKEIDYIENYQSSSYQGPAVKMGAGVQAHEIYEKANELGFTVVGGEGKTVGVAGGYVLGGGHSPLSSIYGLAADQVLAMEVVLANGRFVTVTEESNPDLFWAIRGGGGGTFGVVTSVISRVHPKVGVTVSTFSFATGSGVSVDTFWAGVRSYMERFPAHADAGTYAYFWVLSLGNDSFLFLMNPFFAVNHTLAEYNALVQPWYDELSSLGISMAPNSTYYDNFYDAWMAGFPLETVAISTMMTGSRLFPRANWETDSLFNATFNVLRSTISAGYSVLAFNMKAELPEGYTDNAANPAFRDTLMHAITSTSWDADASNADIKANMDYFTNTIMGQWRATCPDAGAYMSESDIQEPNFQQAFYGSNYARLYKLKQLYDPTGLFYAPTAVGSENWDVNSVDGLPDQNGRLCPV